MICNMLPDFALTCAKAAGPATSKALYGTCRELAQSLIMHPVLEFTLMPFAIVGHSIFAASSLLWHPALSVAVELPEYEMARHMPPAAAVINDSIYITGGQYGGHPLSSLESLQIDPRMSQNNLILEHAKEWTELENPTSPRDGHSASSLHGKLFIVGGFCEGASGLMVLDSAECFDPAAGTWSQLPNMLNKRCGHAATTLLGKLYVCGGAVTVLQRLNKISVDESDTLRIVPFCHNTVESFDLVSVTSEAAQPMCP